VSYSENIWLKISKEAKSLIKRMLTRDPKGRPSAEELLKHEYFTDKVEKPEVSNEFMQEVSNNFSEFRRGS
jgi:serine/threonine protein kinase